MAEREEHEQRLRALSRRYRRQEAALKATRQEFYEALAEANDWLSYSEMARITGLGFDRIRQVVPEYRNRRQEHG